MPNHDDELIKIKKRQKKEKPKKEKQKKASPKKEKTTAEKKRKINATPRAKGVKLDFTEETPEVNRYYMGISKRYRIARYLSIVVLIAFLVVMLVFYRENITYANLMYLVRDLDSEASVEIGVYSDLTYDRGTSFDTELFRSRIALATPTGFRLYSQTGSPDLESDGITAVPRLEVSDKYAIMYGAGEKSYSVYTTLARVLNGECEFEIEDCAVSDSGRYALLTGDDEARFLVTAYSSDFRSLVKFHINKFVMDIAMDEEGKTCAIACADVGTSDIGGELMLGDVDEKKSISVTLDNLMPIACRYADDQRLFVLCDSALLIFEGEKEVKRIDFQGLVPGHFDVSGDIIAISFPTNVIGSENSLRVYNTEGEELYNKAVLSKVVDLSTDGKEAVYAIGETEAYRLSLKDGKLKSEALKDQPVTGLAVPGSLVVFSPEGTSSYFVKEKQ